MLMFGAKAIIACIIQILWIASILSSMLPPFKPFKILSNAPILNFNSKIIQFSKNYSCTRVLCVSILNAIKRIYTIANRDDSSAFIKAKIMFNASRINHKKILPAGMGQLSNFLSLLKGTAFHPLSPFPFSFLYIFRMSFHSHCDIAHVIGFILIIKWNAFAFRLFTFRLGWDYGFIKWKCTIFFLFCIKLIFRWYQM